MNRFPIPFDAEGQAGTLRYMVARARIERRKFVRARYAKGLVDDVAGDVHRRRAAFLVERMLGVRRPGTVRCARFFSSLASRLQMASSVIGSMMTSIVEVTMEDGQARALATVVADLVRYAEGAVTSGGSVRVYLAMALDDDFFIVGIGIEGDAGLVSTASASAAMLRARSIVRLMGGEFQRGSDGDRHVFGLTFPTMFVEAG